MRGVGKGRGGEGGVRCTGRGVSGGGEREGGGRQTHEKMSGLGLGPGRPYNGGSNTALSGSYSSSISSSLIPPFPLPLPVARPNSHPSLPLPPVVLHSTFPESPNPTAPPSSRIVSRSSSARMSCASVGSAYFRSGIGFRRSASEERRRVMWLEWEEEGSSK